VYYTKYELRINVYYVENDRVCIRSPGKWRLLRSLVMALVIRELRSSVHRKQTHWPWLLSFTAYRLQA